MASFLSHTELDERLRPVFNVAGRPTGSLSTIDTHLSMLRSSNGMTRDTDRQIVGVGILLTTCVLAYFYAVDNYYFSSSRMSPIFQYLLLLNDVNTAWLTLGVCVFAACWRNCAPILRIVGFLGAHERAVAAISILCFVMGAIFVYHGNALSMDEYAAVFQAKVFAAGHLTAHLPPSVIDWLIPPGFNGMFLIASRTTGDAIEGYWPGFSLLLAPFEWLGVPSLCNASLSALAILLIHRITLEITGDRDAAGWSVLFAISSGVFVAYGISGYSMQAHLTLNLLFAWLLLQPTAYRTFAAGIVGSLALVLHNPFPHALFAAPWILSFAGSKERRRFLPPMLLGYLPLSICLGAGWLHLRGLVTAGASGFNVIGNNLSDAFRLPDKSMIDARTASIAKLWVWQVPCLLLFAWLGRIWLARDHRVRLLALSAVVTFIGYIFFVFDQGHGWGYRYFHSAWGVLPILAGCALTGRRATRDRLVAFAGVCAILSFLFVIPYQLYQIEHVIARHAAQVPRPRRPGNDVYFVGVSSGFYLGDLVQIDPLLRSQDLILWTQGPVRDAELRRQNWPGAVFVARGFGVEEWSLGPNDHRVAIPGSGGDAGFRLSYSTPAATDGGGGARIGQSTP